MKNYILYMIALITWSSCAKDKLHTYSTTSSVYFTWPAQTVSDYAVDPLPFDSLKITFAWSDDTVKDYLIKIPVSTTGLAVDYDRKFKVVAAANSTAVAGVHYDKIPDDFILGAGKLTDTITIRLLRSEDLKTKEVWLYLQLEPNEEFTTNLQHAAPATLYSLSYDISRFAVRIDEIVLKPENTWDDGLFGAFSKKKMLLICKLNNLPADYFFGTDILEDAGYQQYGYVTRYYLEQQKAAGNTIYEDDGTEMTMGPWL